MVTKRDLLQRFVDEIEKDWRVAQPDPSNPDDREALCIFRKDDKEVRVSLADRLFHDQEHETIKRLVGIALRQKPI